MSKKGDKITKRLTDHITEPLDLLEGQKKNQQYEKARTDMIAGISHDLKTPLTVIRGTVKGMFIFPNWRRSGEQAIG